MVASSLLTALALAVLPPRQVLAWCKASSPFSSSVMRKAKHGVLHTTVAGTLSSTSSSGGDPSALNYMLKPEFKRMENENALFNAGLLILQSSNRVNELQALKFFELAFDLNPLRDGTNFNIALIRDNQGDHADAINYYERTIQLTRNTQLSAAAYNNLIGLYMRIGLLEEAAQTCNKAIEKNPKDANAWTSLGVIMRDEGKPELARDCFDHAINLSEGTNAVALNNMGDISLKLGDIDAAESYFKKACEMDPLDESSLYSLACILRDKGNYRVAAVLLEECIDLNPAHSQAPFMLAAITGATPDQAPSDYVSALFDHYCSSGYESHMVDTLQYSVPRIIRDAVQRAIEQSPLSESIASSISGGSVVDLGAGTGLCSRELKVSGICESSVFTGCDLSASMVAEAAKIGLYTDLAVADCVSYLSTLKSSSCNLVVAGDVLVYIGDLRALFDEIGRVLNDSGMFVATIESIEDVVDAGIDKTRDYVLHKELRYAHSLSYIRSLAAGVGLRVALEEKVGLRVQDSVKVLGYALVFSKQT
jgi:predicted TPR repeat methyltransferase